MNEYAVLNRNIAFSFPHASADSQTDEELATHYFDPTYFAGWMIRTINPSYTPAEVKTHLHSLKESQAIRELAVLWMRCRFLCEVVCTNRLLKTLTKLSTHKMLGHEPTRKPSNTLLKNLGKEEGQPLFPTVWQYVHDEEFRIRLYTGIFMITDKIGYFLYEICRSGNRNNQVPAELSEYVMLNGEFPTVRKFTSVWWDEHPFQILSMNPAYGLNIYEGLFQIADKLTDGAFSDKVPN